METKYQIQIWELNSSTLYTIWQGEGLHIYTTEHISDLMSMLAFIQ